MTESIFDVAFGWGETNQGLLLRLAELSRVGEFRSFIKASENG
jgi:hypothetical protein